MTDSDYPKGDGRPDCNLCHGRGVVVVTKDKRPPGTVGELTQPCACVLYRDILSNLDRGWKGLSKAAPIKKSPLRGKQEQNLWITGSVPRLREHVRHVAIRMGPDWNFQVISDAMMMDAWLSRDLKEIWDPDVERMRQIVSNRYAQLSDLVDPPELLIIQLGVKAARNKAMPEVLLEALNRRYLMHTDKPTWVMDQPIYPLADGHISYSDRVAEIIDEWEHIELPECGKGIDPRKGVQQIVMGHELDPGPFENQVRDLDTSDPQKRRWKRGGKK